MSEQQLLPGYQPSAEDLYQRAVAQPLSYKIEQAIGLLQMHEPPDGYYLAYSGGKDSGVILELARMAGVRFEPWYNVTTLDPPELVRFIRDAHPEVKWSRPAKAMLTMLAREKSCGPPTRRLRWCCERYKEHGGDGRFKIIGVRAEESARRKGVWKQLMPNQRSSHILCPILYWTDDDVWQFHRERNLPYCCLYDEGFIRLGCIGCPMGGPKSQRIEFDRWPGYERAWQRAFKRFWDTWHGVPTRQGTRRWFEDFGSWEGLWDWWISGKRQNGEDEGCQMEFLWQ